jgi:hypothetical protein
MPCTTAIMALAVSVMLAKQAASGTQGRDPVPPTVSFNDKDRQVTRTWYEVHQLNPPAGFRASDRLSPLAESQLKEGLVLDQVLRGQIHPVPSDLLHLLAPPPGIYRYAIVGWHLVLIDDSYRVFDVIHVGHVR